MSLNETFIYPEWPAPANVKALQTTRLGGISAAPYDAFNLGLHVGDDPVRVNRNRQMLAPFMPSEPVWMEQVHGVEVANADAAACRVVADASVAKQRGSVCVIMTADCLPVLLCDEDGSVVAAAHAGWKGLAAGVIEATVKEMGVAPQKLMAWLGPTIGPHAFEVGEDVRAAFMAHDASAAAAFVPLAAEGKYRADMVRLARQRLNALGISRIYGGTFCTFHQKDKFYSYRRDGVTGRMGTFIWLE
ncbi:MAG: peptidoglycan editing factor PgeF [Nitrosomonadales bacterium]|nr:peptidoglycan editing factor PgeF [Nitrosomonadales bacterium]